MRTIVVFLPNWVGDVVMATPALRALRKRVGSEGRLIGVARPYVADVLAGTTWLDETLVFDPAREGLLGMWRLSRAVARRRPEAALLMTASMRMEWVAWAAGAKRRIGTARNVGGLLLTDALPRPMENGAPSPTSAVDQTLALAYRFGCPEESGRLELATTPADEAAADRAWNNLRLPHDGSVVALHAGGGHGGQATAKAWPLENFGELATAIATRLDRHVLVLCGPNEREAARRIVAHANDARVKSLADEPPGIGLTKACLRRVAAIVSTDSGPRHLATAFDKPVVALYGATDPRWSETRHPRGLTIFNKTDCGPCAKKHCPLGHHQCMRGIETERVFAALQEVLASDDRIASRAA